MRAQLLYYGRWSNQRWEAERVRPLIDNEVRSLRMRSQRLAGRRPTNVLDVVRGLGAVQAQDTQAARLAVRARSEGLDMAAVTRACNEQRSVVRTWLMRGTLHMVPAEDVGWMVRLLGASLTAGDRRRRLQLGLTDEVCERALPTIRDILAGGGRGMPHPYTRAELVRALADVGVPIAPKGQAPAHLVFFAATRGVICRGPEREDDEPTYVLLEEWVGRQLNREPEDPLAELALRYIGGHGPASAPDFAAWAGIALGQAWRGLQAIMAELEEVEMGGEPAWMRAGLQDDAARGEPCVRLLPLFDAYLLGYRRRDLALAPQFARRVQAGGGWIHPTVMVDGRIVGTWRQRRKGSALTVAVQPFERLDSTLMPYLEAEAADVGRFLGVEAALAIED
jgi:hypothetical protein